MSVRQPSKDSIWELLVTHHHTSAIITFALQFPEAFFCNHILAVLVAASSSCFRCHITSVAPTRPLSSAAPRAELVHLWTSSWGIVKDANLYEIRLELTGWLGRKDGRRLVSWFNPSVHDSPKGFCNFPRFVRGFSILWLRCVLHCVLIFGSCSPPLTVPGECVMLMARVTRTAIMTR